jgi:hypothetical protein
MKLAFTDANYFKENVIMPYLLSLKPNLIQNNGGKSFQKNFECIVTP